MITLEERARSASGELRDVFATLDAPPLDTAGIAPLLDEDHLDEDGEPVARRSRPRRFATVAGAIAAAIVVFALGGRLLGQSGERVDVAAPDPLTRTEWIELANDQCRAAIGRPELPGDAQGEELVTAIADERAFLRIVSASAERAIERGAPADLVAVTRFARDGIAAIDDALADAATAIEAGDESAAEAAFQESSALGDRVYLELFDAGVTACTREAGV